MTKHRRLPPARCRARALERYRAAQRALSASRCSFGRRVISGTGWRTGSDANLVDGCESGPATLRAVVAVPYCPTQVWTRLVRCGNRTRWPDVSWVLRQRVLMGYNRAGWMVSDGMRVRKWCIAKPPARFAGCCDSSEGCHLCAKSSLPWDMLWFQVFQEVDTSLQE